MSVRVRFAPSPTGALHIGGVRTALFNYLFAKKNNGTFILRIEDTDQKRFVAGAEEYIREALEWSGIKPGEGQGYGGDLGPYRQSERREIYQKYIQQLLDSGNAYYAFDTPEDLGEMRAQAEAAGHTFIYNYQNRDSLNNSLNMSEEDLKKRLNNNEPYVIRFKIPANETLRFSDLIRGKMSVETTTLDDKVLMKNDGFPTYHLANIVDDHLMQISHVIRGEEWLPSLPLHLLMYRAFGWEAPSFAHLPLILKPVGKGKLSKRDGDKFGFPVFPLDWKTEEGVTMGYREQGYLPQAFINMLALLGWNPGTEQEIFSLEELSQLFSIDKVSKKGARFNPEKTVWFNKQYLHQMSDEKLLKSFQEFLVQNEIQSNDDFDIKVIHLMKERADFVKDIWTLSNYFYQTPTAYTPKGLKKVWKNDTQEILSNFIQKHSEIERYNSEEIHKVIKSFVAENEIGFGKIMMPLRLSLVGDLQGPDIPVLMEMLGKSEVEKRIKNLISHQENVSS